MTCRTPGLLRFYHLRALLKMHFSRDSRVSPVLESSCIPYTLRFSVRCFLALTRKSLFLEAPLIWLIVVCAHIVVIDTASGETPGPQDSVNQALLDAISTQVSVGDSASGTFRQRKFIAVLPEPLVSSGHFQMNRHSGLEWTVLEPLASRMIFDHDGIRQSQHGQQVWQLSSEQPGVVIIGQIMQAALALDWPTLDTYFFIDGHIAESTDPKANKDTNVSKRWALTLTPKESVLETMISRITLEGESQIQKLVMFESDNERTELSFSFY